MRLGLGRRLCCCPFTTCVMPVANLGKTDWRNDFFSAAERRLTGAAQGAYGPVAFFSDGGLACRAPVRSPTQYPILRVYDDKGVLEWSAGIGAWREVVTTNYQFDVQMVVDGDDNVIVSARPSGSPITSRHFKLDRGGNTIWDVTSNPPKMGPKHVDPDGDLYAAELGQFVSKFSGDDFAEQWVLDLHAHNASMHGRMTWSGGNWYAVGGGTFSGNLLQITPGGSVTVNPLSGVGPHSTAGMICTANDGGIVFYGVEGSSSPARNCLVKVDTSGSVVWAGDTITSDMGVSALHFSGRLVVDSSDTIYWCGGDGVMVFSGVDGSLLDYGFWWGESNSDFTDPDPPTAAEPIFGVDMYRDPIRGDRLALMGHRIRGFEQRPWSGPAAASSGKRL